eukprot:m.123676 g.123676  ORF g.123676 m.123676 type:complete len:211 (+) comp37831_c0_seq15:593-1225(+)
MNPEGSGLTKFAENTTRQCGGRKCTFLIQGTEQYLRSIKTKVNRDYRSAVESISTSNSRKRKEIISSASRFTEVDIMRASIALNSLGYQCWVLNTPEEIVELLIMTTKAIFGWQSSRFSPFEKNKFSGKDKDDFCNLWKSQLCQFPSVAADAAEAISSVYPNPYTLHKAYCLSDCPADGSQMLQNIESIPKGPSLNWNHSNDKKSWKGTV